MRALSDRGHTSEVSKSQWYLELSEGKFYGSLFSSMVICIGNLPGVNAQTTKDS